jgi:serine/threonine protein kinase
MLGKALGNFKIVEVIGHGGMGVVYKAEEIGTERLAAIKVLPPDLAQDEAALARFRQEAKATSLFRHPHIVQVYDVGEKAGIIYYAMEYVPGRSLSEMIETEGRLEVEEAIGIAADMADALYAVHRRGLIHRDVKSSNILLDAEGQAKLSDFGVSIVSQPAKAARGEVMGTAAYIAPERVLGEEATVQSDIYSLGVVLYEMLAGRLPFLADTPQALAQLHLHQVPTPVETFNYQVTPEVSRILKQAMAKRKVERYATAGELRRDLERALFNLKLTLEGRMPPPRRKENLLTRTTTNLSLYLLERVRTETGLRGRLRRLLESYLNEAVARAADWQNIQRLSLLKSEASLRRAERELAEVDDMRQELYDKYQEAEAQAEDWRSETREAVERFDEAAADEAAEKERYYNELAETCRTEWEASRQIAEELSRSVESIQHEVTLTRDKYIITRARAAQDRWQRKVLLSSRRRTVYLLILIGLGLILAIGIGLWARGGPSVAIEDGLRDARLNTSIWEAVLPADPYGRPVEAGDFSLAASKDGLHIGGKQTLASEGTWPGSLVRSYGIEARDSFPPGDFEARVSIMVPLISGRSYRSVMLQVIDREGTSVLVNFFGEEYSIQRRSKGLIEEVARLVPFGDEARRFHRLRLVYDAKRGLATGFVDGEKIGTIEARLLDLKPQLLVHAWAQGTEVRAVFRDFSFKAE